MIPTDLEDNYSYMFLEQYHLLTGGFSLNSQKIVNFRVNQGKRVYIYNKDKTVLYFQDISYNNVRNKLSIHVESLAKHINKDNLFLDTFAITNFLIAGAQNTDLTLEGFNNLLDEKRSLAQSITFSSHKRNMGKAVWLRHETSKDIKEFVTQKDAVKYLKDRDYTVDRNTATKKLDTGKVYKDHY